MLPHRRPRVVAAGSLPLLSPCAPSSTLDSVPFVIMSKDRNDALRNSVVSILRSVFDRNVQGSAFNEWVWRHRLTSRRLSLVLKSYVTLDMVEEIQRYYRENFVPPFLDTIITRVGVGSPSEA